MNTITDDPVTKELDETIGLRYWQLFYAVFFWSNFATLLNLAIEILAALTTAKATISGTDPLLHVRGITIALVVLTTINLVLGPANQAANYTGMLLDWRKFGARFETLYYSKLEKNEWTEKNEEDLRKLLAEVNQFDAPSIIHPVTEVIATLMIQIWRRRRNSTKWMEITNPRIYVSPDANDNSSSGSKAPSNHHVALRVDDVENVPPIAAASSITSPPGPGATSETTADRLISTRRDGGTAGPSTSPAGGNAPGSSIPLAGNSSTTEVQPANTGSAPPAMTTTLP
ncbi:hypothetical protein Vretimale_18494 [Volvox reticuliferus]|uniref:Uncharacterized protein n=1 Tax=Volvox reticuliferus TaxID=1737510 RepID=A0A8J4FWN9_9CHLO|nr:hypothetical protein Vretifemale_19769 [Volvox reticuliferus]GIM15788.1 hypothetical protein Vretimale_18494 [Volvox reticuliferus]